VRAVHAVLAAAVILMTAACGDEGGQQSLGAADPASSPSGSAAVGVVAQTDLGPLPAPTTLADLQRRTVSMPDAVAGAGRTQGPPEQVRYAGETGEFGIEVSDVEDLYPDVETAADAFPRLREQLGAGQVCAQLPSYCLRGSSDGQVSVIWGHEDSALVFAALAPDEATLSELLDAWRAGS
jgi:hypothetical protein